MLIRLFMWFLLYFRGDVNSIYITLLYLNYYETNYTLIQYIIKCFKKKIFHNIINLLKKKFYNLKNILYLHYKHINIEKFILIIFNKIIIKINK
jgi:hypothetical protein